MKSEKYPDWDFDIKNSKATRTKTVTETINVSERCSYSSEKYNIACELLKLKELTEEDKHWKLPEGWRWVCYINNKYKYTAESCYCTINASYFDGSIICNSKDSSSVDVLAKVAILVAKRNGLPEPEWCNPAEVKSISELTDELFDETNKKDKEITRLNKEIEELNNTKANVENTLANTERVLKITRNKLRQISNEFADITSGAGEYSEFYKPESK